MAEYSLGHEILLFRRRNAFLVLSEAEFSKLEFWEQIHAIRQAVWLCSDPFSVRARFERPARLMLRFRWNEFKLRRWEKSLKNLLPDDYALAAAEFRNYLADAHASLPGPDERAGEVCAEAGGYEPMSKMTGRKLGAPYTARLLDFVTANGLHRAYGFANPFDFPYVLADMLYAVRLEAKGNLWIENYDEWEEKRDYEEQLAKLREKDLAGGNDSAPAPAPRQAEETGLATTPPPELSKPSTFNPST